MLAPLIVLTSALSMLAAPDPCRLVTPRKCAPASGRHQLDFPRTGRSKTPT